MSSKTDIEIFELLCYYQMRETGKSSFSVKKTLPLYEEAGLPAPERSALERQAKKHPHFKPYGIEGTLKFAYGVVGSMDKTYGHLWSGPVIQAASPKKNAPETALPRSLSLMEFAGACKLSSKDDIEVFELLCYYQMREGGARTFTVRGMEDIYTGAGLEVPKRSALEKRVRKHPNFKPKGIDGSVEFAPGAVGSLDNAYGHLWAVEPDAPAAKAASAGIEVLSEERFCGKRDGLDRLIVQVNSTYRDGSFDACASVMRRLLEAVLILSFQAKGIENEIRAGSSDYVGFDDIVRKAAASGALDLSGKGIDISAVSRIGDYTGRGPMYTFGANDINSVRTGYRNVLETLYELF
ncbi:MAG: hypothetical protein LBI08_03095 [Methanomassiliicoccaceae archaeon]|nr:hypothetical protein [Methanomassiliicoccaceae archaeon]